MARKSRITEKNNIVIVCEGTDTEVKYFTDLKNYVETHFPDRFSDIRIVPTASELVVSTNRNKNKKLRTVSKLAYYIQEESNADDFDRYKSQPTRYVREAELFILNDGYLEGWAVYDHDNFPDHEFAKSHADSIGVKIAFSSISFEEWILVHFERNETAFSRSVCKEDKHDILCGTGTHKDDCHGDICVGGCLREHKHIPEYGKNMDGLFHHIFDKHKLAIINAAWTRSLHDNKAESFWECNPLTTVDRLVSCLLGYNQDFSWISNPESFTLDRTILKISENSISNIGENPIVVNYTIYDANMEEIGKYNTGLLNVGNKFELYLPENARYMGINSRKGIKITTI